MGRIQILSSALADQIAAGEVVERPASVVKELVENALDAGATTIELEIDDGGVGLIEVRDDGHGMERDDAALSVQRHATSKLRSFDDLLRLRTMGFRGEALPSIASVSKLELLTRTAENNEGTHVFVDAGGEPKVHIAGCRVGTVIRVRDLFFNVPARRKFLKSKNTENAQVAQVLRRVALAHPDLRLRLTREGRTALEFLPTKDFTHRLKDIFPGDRFTFIEQERGPIRVRAWLGQPSNARSGANRLYLFVNDRPVQDRGLARAVVQAHHDVIDAGKYPNGVVFLELPPHLVDVNVHPQKSEVRFADEEELLRTVASLLATGLFKEQSATAAVSPSPARSDASLPRHKSYWNDRLGLGQLKDGQKLGTAVVRKQGGSRPAAPAQPAASAAPPRDEAPSVAPVAEPADAPAPPPSTAPARARPADAAPERAPSPTPARTTPHVPATAPSAGPRPSSNAGGQQRQGAAPVATVATPPTPEGVDARVREVLAELDPSLRDALTPRVVALVSEELHRAAESLEREADELRSQGLDAAAQALDATAAELRSRSPAATRDR